MSMTESFSEDRPGPFRTLATFLLRMREQDDEITFDSFRGFRDPREEAFLELEPDFGAAGGDFRPN